MKIMIESTCRMVTICQGREEIPARVWEGATGKHPRPPRRARVFSRCD